jgi:hypothetical protein
MYAFLPSWHEFKNSNEGKSRSAALAATHEHPFLLHYCGIGDFIRDAAEAQTNGSATGQCQDYRTVTSD